MSRKRKNADLTRREFVTTVGLAGLALAGRGATAALAAPEPPPATQADTVPRRQLGKTGVDVSILSLGCMFDTINNQLLLKQALKWGVTYWDTAEHYGNTLSEEGIGRFFSRNPEARQKVFLVTKLDAKGGDFTKRLDQCLQRMQTSHLDLFLVPAVDAVDQLTPAIRDWAAAMKKAGKFKFFGFATHTNMEDCLLGAAKLDWIDVVMTTYNFRVMGSPKMQEAVDACAKAGVGLVAMKSQAGRPSGSEVARRCQGGRGRAVHRTRVHRQAGQAQGGVGKSPHRQYLLPDAQPHHHVGQRGGGPGPEQTDPGGDGRHAAICPGNQGGLLRRLRQNLPGGRGRGRPGARGHALPYVPPVLWRAGTGQADLLRATRGG